MKKCLKIISVLISIIILFTSCSKASPDSVTNKMKSYFTKNDYNACKTYLMSLDGDVKKQISPAALKLTEEEFTEAYQKYKEYDIFDITLFDANFIEKCSNLWKIASEFTPGDDENFNENLQYLRYFAEISDSMRYKEMIRMLKNMYNCGYMYSIQKSLSDYNESGEYAYFETAKKIAAEFKFTDYNPQEYYISELRSVCEKMNKNLTSVNNGFATNDTGIVASAINNIYKSADTILFACDCAEAIHNALNEAMNTFRLNGAFTEYKNEIKFDENRKYEAGTDFLSSNIFGSAYTPPSNSDTDNSGNESNRSPLSKKDAAKIAVNAINKTKAYKSDITVNKTQTVDIQMTGFKTESELTSSVSIVRIKINDALKKSNGMSKDSKKFSGGKCEGLSLYDSIPPSGHSASLDPSFVENYTAVKGSGGYVITFTLSSCTSTDENISHTLISMVDGFYFDNSSQNIQHKTFYKPTSISIIVNNSGYLSKYSYTISGVADCKFTEKGEQVATSEFSFKQQYDYEFIY